MCECWVKTQTHLSGTIQIHQRKNVQANSICMKDRGHCFLGPKRYSFGRFYGAANNNYSEGELWNTMNTEVCNSDLAMWVPDIRYTRSWQWAATHCYPYCSEHSSILMGTFLSPPPLTARTFHVVTTTCFYTSRSGSVQRQWRIENGNTELTDMIEKCLKNNCDYVKKLNWNVQIQNSSKIVCSFIFFFLWSTGPIFCNTLCIYRIFITT